MLVQIQKLLNETQCPSCGKHSVLQATLSCSRDDKKCTTACQCSQCGINLILQIPETMNIETAPAADMKLECSLSSSSCEIVELPSGFSKAS
jgi:hypothetical protein